MKKIFCTLLYLSFFQIIIAQGWNRDQLETAREHLDVPAYSLSYKALLKEADKLLNRGPLSVMIKKRVAISGNKHDYLSQARYYWPDPKSHNGLPYISKDGESNPELDELDRNRLGEMSENVSTLTLAWFMSNNKAYAEKAAEQIKVWFLNKDTYMTPHFKYAQIIRGKNNDLGRSYGLIDGYSFVSILDALTLLEESGTLSNKEIKELKKWFSQLLDWYIESPQGKEEAEAVNNHSLAYHVQITAFALYCNRNKLADRLINEFPQKRIFKQIEPDGKQPMELKRTLAFGYSQFNIQHMIDMFQLAAKRNIRIDNVTSKDGRNIYKAVDFLLPYLGKSVKEWPYKQISEWNYKQQAFCKDIYRLYKISPERKDYKELYKKNRKFSWSDSWNLLYLNLEDAYDDMAFLDGQLRYAIESADSTLLNSKEKGKVSPRSLEKDGSLRMVAPKDWCSGFFPGMLWMMYEQTNKDFWRQQANFYTLPLESNRNHKGTHDLGFMMHNSFGKAWQLTKEKAYYDINIESAKTLCKRFNPNVGSIRSWDHNKDKWKFPVIIDNMMNLELLFWATEATGDSTFYNIAVSHANVTLKNHFRDDNSSFHVVDYDPITGEVIKKITHQGYSDESVWSRGQGWGLYGFTVCYRYTKDKRYLEQACKIAEYFMTLPNMPKDNIPYWDMNDPQIPDVSRDASAASIIASGLYELSTYVDDERKVKYENWANSIVSSLTQKYRPKIGTVKGFLLLHSTGNRPANDEIDVPIIYADYYYMEALQRKNNLGL